MKIALFQFATNAVGETPAVFENMLASCLANALERAACLRVIDLSPPPREGEVLSLTEVLKAEEVGEVANRVGAEASLWGDLHFRPDGRPLIEAVEVAMLAARSGEEAAAEERRFPFDGLRGDVRSGDLNVDMGALEDLVEEMLLALADVLGLEKRRLQLSRIGEGLTHSDRAMAYFVRALRISTDPETKLRLYRKAISADPDFELAYTNAAQLLLGEGRHGEAMRLLLRAQNRLRGSELEADVLNLLGVAAMHMGMWEEAVKVWGDALELRPDYVEVICNLASAHAMREMYEEAEGYYRQALSMREDYPLAWFSLGRLLAREERFEEAEASMRRYTELCPGDPWAYYIMGASLASLGREGEAEFALAKAAQLDPEGEAGTLARQELHRLKE